MEGSMAERNSLRALCEVVGAGQNLRICEDKLVQKYQLSTTNASVSIILMNHFLSTNSYNVNGIVRFQISQ